MAEAFDRRDPAATTVRCIVPHDVARLIGVPLAPDPAAAETAGPGDVEAHASARLAAVAPLSNPQRYLKVGVVGRGGMGVVHRVRGS